jgi:hypothetical protein
VDAVVLVEARDASDAFQEEGDQGNVHLPGKAGVHLREAVRVLGAVVRGDLHAEEEDAGSGLLGTADDLPQVVLGLLERQAAEAVVAAEADHDHVRLLREQPVETGEAAGGRVAAHPGVDDPDRMTGLLQPGLDQDRIGLASFETQSRGQAVAQKDDERLIRAGDRRGPGDGSRGRPGDRGGGIGASRAARHEQDSQEEEDGGGKRSAHQMGSIQAAGRVVSSRNRRRTHG